MKKTVNIQKRDIALIWVAVVSSIIGQWIAEIANSITSPIFSGYSLLALKILFFLAVTGGLIIIFAKIAERFF